MTENHRTWDELLPEISLALRTAVHAVTKCSPFFLNHAREFAYHASDYSPNARSDGNDPVETRTRFLETFKMIFKDISSRIKASYDRNKKHYDGSRSAASFRINDPIYYRNFVKSDKAKAFMKKLAPIYLPGIITQVITELAYIVSDTSGNLIGKFHVQDLRPRSEATDS